MILKPCGLSVHDSHNLTLNHKTPKFDVGVWHLAKVATYSKAFVKMLQPTHFCWKTYTFFHWKNKISQISPPFNFHIKWCFQKMNFFGGKYNLKPYIYMFFSFRKFCFRCSNYFKSFEFHLKMIKKKVLETCAIC